CSKLIVELHVVAGCDVLVIIYSPNLSSFFFFNDPAPTEIYTLSLHDALPILRRRSRDARPEPLVDRRLDGVDRRRVVEVARPHRDRKSTRLNSSHLVISYAVFCLKKKKQSMYLVGSLCGRLYLSYSAGTARLR